MRVIFILPGLFRNAATGERGHECLRRLLARSQAEPSPKSSGRLLLSFYLFAGQQEAITESHLAYWSDFMRAPARYCYYCEPVHLRADLSDAIVFDRSQFNLTLAEAQCLVDAINQYLEDSFYRVELADVYRWYLLSEKELGAMPALPEMQGRPAGAVLTNAACAREWRSLMNELQILLHQQAANAEREQRGELPVNAVWIHAGTSLKIPHYEVRCVISRSSHAQTLSKRLALDCKEELDASAFFRCRDDMVLFDESLAVGSDSASRQSRLEWMEERWFRLAYAGLRQKKIDEIVIDGCDGRRFIIRRGFLGGIWRRLYPLSAYAEQSA